MGFFSRFLNCTNDTKSCNASYLILFQIIDYIGQRLKINPEDLRLWRFETEVYLNILNYFSYDCNWNKQKQLQG